MSSQSSGSNSSAQPTNIVTAWPSTQTLPGSISNLSVGPQPTINPPRLYPVSNHPLWNHVPPPFTHMSSTFATQPAAPVYNVNAASRTGERHDQVGVSSPSTFGRKQGRKDFHYQNVNRSSRPFNNRNGRGHIHNQNVTGHTEGDNSHYRNSQFVNTPDWSHYARR